MCGCEMFGVGIMVVLIYIQWQVGALCVCVSVSHCFEHTRGMQLVSCGWENEHAVRAQIGWELCGAAERPLFSEAY